MDLKLEHWQKLYSEMQADLNWVGRWTKRFENRKKAQPEMLNLLRDYLAGSINLESFRAAFDRKTKTDWIAFGFKSMSGGMFLNQLVKNLPDQASLDSQLKNALSVPQLSEQAKIKMKTFIAYLEELLDSKAIPRNRCNPARVPFFFSAWWHLQSPEDWPVFYPKSRQALQSEELYVPVEDDADSYFLFRDVYKELARGLSLASWQLEALACWHQRPSSSPPSPPAGPVPPEEEKTSDNFDHTLVQGLLATLGKSLGCKVWIASNDQSKEYKGKKLSELSVAALPSLGLDEQSQKIISRIDVVWLKGNNQVAAVFEIEQTTSIYSGLLRMADLAASAPNLNFPLYIVTPISRLEKVRQELQRPAFQKLELHKRCGFFSMEKLGQEADQMMRYASGPTVIDKLAEWAGDSVNED